jgi:ABC-type spermidine/putrescine transport system permease subunit II
VAPGVFNPSSICASMNSAIFTLAKPLSFASGSSFRAGAIGPSRCASASAMSAAYFGTTMALALMQERPPFSEMLATITSR